MIIPIPTYREEEPVRHIVIPTDQERDRWVRWFMDSPTWVCECRLTNFGRNLQCARDTCKKARPSSYVENEYGM